MHGYHYTTKEAWKVIQREGMRPAPIRQCEYDKFLNAVPLLPPDAIWVWREPLSDEQAYITLIQLAEAHQSFDMVLLKVNYEKWASASHTCKEIPDDKIRLKCSFSVGRLYTGSLLIDLIICDVPTTNIELIWQVNLLDAMKGRHAAERHFDELLETP